LREDLPDFLCLAVGVGADVALLHPPQTAVVGDVGAGAGEVAGRHRKTVGDQVGAAEDQDDPRIEARPDRAGDDRERRHGPIDAAVDPIAQIRRPRPVGEARGDRLRRAAVLESHAGLRKSGARGGLDTCR
jgi:hypothetical protein